jgi:hypothetical protein
MEGNSDVSFQESIQWRSLAREVFGSFTSKNCTASGSVLAKRNLPRLLLTVPRKPRWGLRWHHRRDRDWVVHNRVRGLHWKVVMSRKWKIYTMHWNLRRQLCGTPPKIHPIFLNDWLRIFRYRLKFSFTSGSGERYQARICGYTNSKSDL